MPKLDPHAYSQALRRGLSVRLPYRQPYDWQAMLAFLRARAIAGVEQVVDGRYTRTMDVGGQLGTVEIVHSPADTSLVATLRLASVFARSSAVVRLRRVLDLDADVIAIGRHLARDPLLKPLVAARPGLRVPGGWDGFELAVRAILGQQVSLEAGRRLTEQLVGLCASPGSADKPLSRAFPSAERVAATALDAMKMPGARKKAIVALATAAIADPRLFHSRGTVEATVAELVRVNGVGDWTAHYIALRASREADAFPATDVSLLRSFAKQGGTHDAAALRAHAERWRPWRAYAAQHLWAADAS